MYTTKICNLIRMYSKLTPHTYLILYLTHKILHLHTTIKYITIKILNNTYSYLTSKYNPNILQNFKPNYIFTFYNNTPITI